MGKKQEKRLDRLRDAVLASLDATYDLVYIDYRSELSRDQIDAVIQRNWDDVDDDWMSESEGDGARYEAREALSAVISQWEREKDKDYTALKGAFEYSEQWDEVIDTIRDRNTGDPWKQLAHNTGRVLMRQVIAGEDSSLYGNHSPSAVWRWLKDNAEPGTVLKRNKHNLDVIRATINESMHSLAFSMGMLVYAADVGDIYDMPHDTEWVEIVNPYLYIGNYYQGDGYCSDEPLDAVFRVKRSEITTDRGAPGYGWDEVAGVVTSAYEAEVRAVPTVTAALA